MSNEMKPWLPPDAITFLDHLLTELNDGDDPVYVMEHGAGTSTPWLAKRCDFLLSFESDPKWYGRVGSWLREERLLGHTMLVFASAMDTMGVKLPREAPRTFDIVFVDGRGRKKFWDKAVKYLKPGGWVVWDDAERPKYWPRTELIMKKFKEVQKFYKPEKPRAYTLVARKPHET